MILVEVRQRYAQSRAASCSYNDSSTDGRFYGTGAVHGVLFVRHVLLDEGSN